MFVILPHASYNDEQGENLRRHHFRNAWYEYLAREQNAVELPRKHQVDNPCGLRYFSVAKEQT